MTRVELDLVGRPGAGERERRPAVIGLVDARRRARCGHGAAVRGDSPRAGARGDQDVVGVGRVDCHAADRAVGRNAAAVRAGDERPAVAAVGAAVEAETGLAVAAPVGLAGADVDRVPTRVGRVDGDRADRARRDVAGDEVPLRLLRESVLRAPDAAAGGADVQRALLGVALRVDGESRLAARPLRSALVGLSAEPVDVHRRRAERLPSVLVLGLALGDLRAGGDRSLPLAEGDLVARIRTSRELFAGRAVWIDVCSLGDLCFATALANAPDRGGVLLREPGFRRRARARAAPERQCERHDGAQKHHCKHELAPVRCHLGSPRSNGSRFLHLRIATKSQGASQISQSRALPRFR